MHMIPRRSMRMCRPDLALERLDQLCRAFAPTRDVVAHMEHTRRSRRRRQQRIKRRHAPRIRGRNAEPHAHIVETRFADPTDARLKRLECGQQQVATLTLLASAGRHVGIAFVATLSAIPCRSWRTKQSVYRGTLFVGWLGVPQVQIHQSSPAAAKGSALRKRNSGVLATGSTRTAHALNSAVPDRGSVALIVKRFVATSSGKCNVMNTTPARSERSTYTGASIDPRRDVTCTMSPVSTPSR